MNSSDQQSVTKGKTELLRRIKSDEVGDQLSDRERVHAINYMSFFGYLTAELLKNVDYGAVLSQIKKMQKWFGLKVDGVLGPKTFRVLATPRCGCPDIIDKDNDVHIQYVRMQEVAAANLAKWRKHKLTYYIAQHVSGISKSGQEAILANAWDAWSDICGIGIQRTRSAADADIVIGTGSGVRHKFDGQGGTLAWAYLPNGQDRQLLMRFDLAETWTTNVQDRGILLFNVACHEFGHLLGLQHSRKKRALMAPYYNPGIARPQADDDIPRAVARYGKPENKTPTDGNDETQKQYVIRCSNLEVVGHTLFSNG